MKTKTIFRTWRDTGEVIAIFPEIAGDCQGHYPASYMHVGQHGASSSLPHNTRPSTKEEISNLLKELISIGYDVKQVFKETRKMRSKRYDEVRT
jgi:hypothetical protein